MIENKFSNGSKVKIISCPERDGFREKFVGTIGEIIKTRKRNGQRYYVVVNNDGLGREYLAGELRKINYG